VAMTHRLVSFSPPGLSTPTTLATLMTPPLAAGAEVVGVSGDSAASHAAFARKHGLPYSIVSDADGALRRLYGVPRTLGFLPGRVTYVIDREGIVRLVFNSAFSSSGHVRRALDAVR